VQVVVALPVPTHVMQVKTAVPVEMLVGMVLQVQAVAVVLQPLSQVQPVLA
jgi:hypothetical protein